MARLAAVGLLGGGLFFTGLPNAPASTGEVALVSHVPGSTTAGGDQGGYNPAVSADGAWIVFTSKSTNLVTGQTTTASASYSNVFLTQRSTGVTQLVSHVPGNRSATPNKSSSYPTISADGSWIAFSSDSTNLVTGQNESNLTNDEFLYERSTGSVTLISHVAGDVLKTSDMGVDTGRISADGRFVLFSSESTNLVPGQVDTFTTGGNTDFFLYERATGTTMLVTHVPGSAVTASSGAYVSNAMMTPDASYIAFDSRANNLVAGQVDDSRSDDTFLYERSTGAITLVSHQPGSPATAVGGSFPTVSDDGRFVAFNSQANNLATTDTNNTGDVFLFDRTTGTTTLVSHVAGSPTMTTTAGTQGDGSTGTVSSDGRFVLFDSPGTNLVAGQSATVTRNVFLWERATNTVSLVSHLPGSSTAPANADSSSGTTSGDSRFVSFTSKATNLVTGQTDANGGNDVFLFDRSSGLNTLVSHAVGAPSTAGDGTSYVKQYQAFDLSNDGSVVVFTSSAKNLVAGQATGAAANAFSFERSATTPTSSSTTSSSSSTTSTTVPPTSSTTVTLPTTTTTLPSTVSPNQTQFLNIAPSSGPPGTVIVVAGKCPAFNPEHMDRPLDYVDLILDDGAQSTSRSRPLATPDGRFISTLRVPAGVAPYAGGDVVASCFYRNTPKTPAEIVRPFQITAAPVNFATYITQLLNALRGLFLLR